VRRPLSPAAASGAARRTQAVRGGEAIRRQPGVDGAGGEGESMAGPRTPGRGGRRETARGGPPASSPRHEQGGRTGGPLEGGRAAGRQRRALTGVPGRAMWALRGGGGRGGPRGSGGPAGAAGTAGAGGGLRKGG
jgi:hypothetical protein